MAYRLNNIPTKPEDMLIRYPIRNGAIKKVVFKCYYYTPGQGHDPEYHDYIGWPDPHHPGHACQMASPRDVDPSLPMPVLRVPDDQVPIHFIEEGYTDAIVVFDNADAYDGISCSASIDNTDDYMVIVKFDTFFPSFEDEPKEFRFTVFVTKEDARDAVCHGILIVQPGSPCVINNS